MLTRHLKSVFVFFVFFFYQKSVMVVNEVFKKDNSSFFHFNLVFIFFVYFFRLGRPIQNLPLDIPF